MRAFENEQAREEQYIGLQRTIRSPTTDDYENTICSIVGIWFWVIIDEGLMASGDPAR